MKNHIKYLKINSVQNVTKKKNQINPRINSIENERIKEKRKRKRNRGI